MLWNETEIRGKAQFGLTWDPEKDLSTTKKVRGSILENNGKWNRLRAQVTGSYTESISLENYTTNWAAVVCSQWASRSGKKKKVEETQIIKMFIIPVAFM